jgi:hypothetical protein
MSITLSPPIRVFALLGALVAVGLAGFVFFAGGTGSESVGTTVTTPTRTTGQPTPATQPNTPSRQAQTPRAPVVTRSGFPRPVDRALRRHPVVVVVVYMPRASVDAVVGREGGAKARTPGDGFLCVSALSERLVRPLVAKTGVLPDPAILVVKRPGVVTTTLSVTDRSTVAQAVAQARR